MKVRRAEPGDAAAVAGLWTEAYTDDHRGGRSTPYRDEDLAEAAELGKAWVAEDDEGLAGAVVLYPPGASPARFAEAGERELSRLAVAARARRLGLGRRLVALCLEEAAAEGASAVVLWSQTHQVEAHRLYESLGFRRASERDGADASGPQLVFIRSLEAEQRPSPLELVEELHRRQRAMYGGGPIEPILELLAPEVVWHVPGASPIAGSHRGHDGVAAYFERRRRLANATMRMHPGKVVVEEDCVAQFVLGSATLGGRQVSWQTVGVYRVDPWRLLVLEVWLVALDGDLFDQVWRGAEIS